MAKNNIEVKILGDAKGLTGAIDSAEGKLGRFGGNVAKVGVALGALAVAGGAALLALGNSLDGAYDSIVVGTGATGEALDRLKGDFEAVASSVPASFGDVGTAIADLNTRLGLTGQPLQEMSSQFLELSRLTKTDVAGNIKSLTRVFGDAGIAAEDQSVALDQLFRVSQATGIGMDQLGNTMVQFGAPLRQLGFGFETSAALIAKFEKEGVNTEAVMSGMKIGLGKLSAAGEEPAEAFARITEEIKNAGSAGEANAIAIELFGQRAGPDMAAAVREGRFEIDDLMASMEGAEGAIMDTAEQTESWQQKLKVLTNKVMLKFAPIAERMFEALGTAIQKAAPYVEMVAEWLGENIPKAIEAVRPVVEKAFNFLVNAAKSVVDWFTTNWPKIQAAIMPVFDWLMDNKSVIVGALAGIGVLFGVWAVQAGLAALATIAAAAPVIALVAGLAALGAAIAYAYTNFEGFRNVVDAVWQALQAAATIFIDFMQNVVWPVINEVIGFLVDEFTEFASFISDNWEQIQEAIATVVDWIATYIRAWIKIITTAWEIFGDSILSYITMIWENIKTIISAALDIIKGIIKTVTSIITGDWSGAWEGIKMIFSGVWDAISGVVTNVFGFISGEISRVLGVISGAWEATWGGISSFVSTTWEAITGFVSGGVDDLVGFVTGIPGRVTEAVSGAFDGIKDAFRGAINWVIDAINSIQLPGITIGGWDPPGPGPKVPSFTTPTLDPFPYIPRLHDGGMVGPWGQLGSREVPAILEVGEYVVSRADLAAMSKAEGKGQGPLVNIENATFSDGQDAEMLAATINFKMG